LFGHRCASERFDAFHRARVCLSKRGKGIESFAREWCAA